MKTLTKDEVQDKLIGEKGSRKRVVFEKELQIEKVGKQTQKVTNPNDIFLSLL